MSGVDPLLDLKGQWRALTGQDAPRGLSGKLLAAALSFEQQCQASASGGAHGLTLADRKRLTAIARGQSHAGEDGKPNDRPSLQSKAKSPAESLSLGTQFVREWQGQDQVVTVVDGGFLWNGAVYRSLSAVARAITGTRWNGRRFFWLSSKPKGTLQGKVVADG
ncbi:MAG: DUF2924 domain-containing protein [Pseudomonadota bacterium]